MFGELFAADPVTAQYGGLFLGIASIVPMLESEATDVKNPSFLMFLTSQTAGIGTRVLP